MRSRRRTSAAWPSTFLSRFARQESRRKNREIERTNYWNEKIAIMTRDLDEPSRKPAAPRTKRSPNRAEWSPERRAKQAERIRANQPWLKSTGPRTDAGKARSAANAGKYGFRSEAFIERVREERQLVRDAASTIALIKRVLRLARVSTGGRRSCVIRPGDLDFDDRPSRPGPPVKPL